MINQIKMRVHCKDTGKILAYEVFNTILNDGYYWADAPEDPETRLCNTENYFRPATPFVGLIRVLFTGLKDTNGVEIYETDIVSIPGHGNCEVKICPHYGVTYTGSDGYAVPHADCAAEMDYPTVIGNIQQNS